MMSVCLIANSWSHHTGAGSRGIDGGISLVVDTTLARRATLGRRIAGDDGSMLFRRDVDMLLEKNQLYD